MVISGLNSLSVPVASSTDVLVVSSVAKDYASRLGFSRIEVAQVGLAAGELASNCVRHGGGGRIELRGLDSGLELRAIDSGPGIENVRLAEEDGVSRGRRRSVRSARVPNSLGAGLGSVRRLMDDVQIYSYRALGTTVIARKHFSEREP